VLVLLPPSQGKASPDRGRRAGLSTLVYARLREPRERLIDAVDSRLRTAPAIPAAELYTGVLFAALGLADLPWDDVLISSALWGVVRPGDRIPAYRLDMSAKPPGIGSPGPPGRGAERPEEVAEIATAAGLRVELSAGLLDVIE
jgi:uncharacterized protein